MSSRRLLLLTASLAALAVAGCKTPYKESDKKKEEAKKDASGDPTFQAFVGRLKIAASKRDQNMLRSLMAPDFGYRWDNPPPGDNIFTYWDLNNLWPDLNHLLEQKFTLMDDFMVSPPEFASDPNTYGGYRLGIKQVAGSWRFIYFVPPPPAEQAPASPSEPSVRVQ